MKHLVFILLSAFLLNPISSLSQTEPDTGMRIFHNIREYNHISNNSGSDGDINSSDSIELCAYLYPVSEKNYKTFCEELEDEGIHIFWTEFSEGTANTVISIRITKTGFEHIFNGILEYKLVPASSHSGFIRQMFVKSYTVPEKYKKIIESITTPDPQTGGC